MTTNTTTDQTSKVEQREDDLRIIIEVLEAAVILEETLGAESVLSEADYEMGGYGEICASISVLGDKAKAAALSLAKRDADNGWCFDMNEAPRDGTKVDLFARGKAKSARLADMVYQDGKWGSLEKSLFTGGSFHPVPSNIEILAFKPILLPEQRELPE